MNSWEENTIIFEKIFSSYLVTARLKIFLEVHVCKLGIILAKSNTSDIYRDHNELLEWYCSFSCTGLNYFKMWVSKELVLLQQDIIYSQPIYRLNRNMATFYCSWMSSFVFMLKHNRFFTCIAIKIESYSNRLPYFDLVNMYFKNKTLIHIQV